MAGATYVVRECNVSEVFNRIERAVKNRPRILIDVDGKCRCSHDTRILLGPVLHYEALRENAKPRISILECRDGWLITISMALDRTPIVEVIEVFKLPLIPLPIIPAVARTLTYMVAPDGGLQPAREEPRSLTQTVRGQASSS